MMKPIIRIIKSFIICSVKIKTYSHTIHSYSIIKSKSAHAACPFIDFSLFSEADYSPLNFVCQYIVQKCLLLFFSTILFHLMKKFDIIMIFSLLYNIFIVITSREIILLDAHAVRLS